MRSYKNEYLLCYINPETFDGELDEYQATVITASPLAKEVGIDGILRHGSEENIKYIYEVVGNSCLFLWQGEINYNGNDGPFNLKLETEGKWIAVESNVKDFILMQYNVKE